MAEQNVGNGEVTEAKAGKLELAQKPESKDSKLAVRTEDPKGEMQYMSYLGDRPIGDGAIEVAEQFTSAGVRPIAASHMEVFGTILNGRPILASHLQVVEYALPGNRPVFASDIVVCDDLTLPGGRPIIASSPDLLAATLLPGGRPIASNEIDDSETLMGFLD
ncbi:hypothetical protein [Leptolyngbya ohadii]|uniref:hypothetical protein n=1 Tax=Leptolyngbya ohadii TaxID=1962290 RepID=UPI000B59F12F|nr:hypothetical protein [Leptolyngbya ohadii]